MAERDLNTLSTTPLYFSGEGPGVRYTQAIIFRNLMMNNVPLLDISPFFGGTMADKKAVAQAVGRACEQIGFLTLTGHGIPLDLIRNVNAMAARFFDLPMADKMRFKGQTPGMGYLPPEGENLAASLDMKAAHDLKESLNLNLNTARDSWPDTPPELASVCRQYFDAVQRLAGGIMSIFALALDLPERFFEDKIDRPIATLRLLNYPAVERTPEADQFRASAHTDYGTITILWSEAIAGLQVRNRDGEWVDVRSVLEAFVVNIGDLMARWTNDCWISTLHRVVVPEDEARRTKRRQSTVFFHNPNPDTIVACLDSCVSADNPAKYPPVLTDEFFQMKSGKSLGVKK
jgi:isopenicillin N synthase-like dioxygenase